MIVYVLVDEFNINNTCTVYSTRKRAEKEWDRLKGNYTNHQGYHIEEKYVID